MNEYLKEVSKTELHLIEVLDPTVPPATKPDSLSPALPKLDQKLSISFFWNSKPNGDLLLYDIKERLSRIYPQLEMPWFQKGKSSAAADPSMINQVATNADLVIIATAD
jgi:hypothetical protein